jgi:RNA polymerase sigma-70 factor, ECF subfamily
MSSVEKEQMTTNVGGDRELSRALAGGDLEALSRVYDAYGVHAYSVALRMLGDSSRAEDVVFEAFLRLWKESDRFDPERESLRSHLIASVRRLALGELKGPGASQAEQAAAHPVDFRPDIWNGATSTAVGKAVREGMADLPSDQRQALELACFSGYSYEEIAEATQTPVTGVKSAMRSALEKLHSFLQVRGLVHES